MSCALCPTQLCDCAKIVAPAPRPAVIARTPLNITRDEAVEMLRQRRAEKCRASLDYFVRYFWPELEPNGRPYQANRATGALICHAEAVGRGQIRRLGIAIAPGMGKTNIISVALPAWMWTWDNTRRYICASHTYNLAAETIAPKFLRLVTSEKYQNLFGMKFASTANKAIRNTASGVRYAVGTDTAVVGIRGDLAIIDDSLSAMHASNAEHVAEINEWFDNSIDTRIDHGKDGIIAVQQRLAENDLIQHMRELGAEILEMPSRFETKRRCVTSIWQDDRTVEGEILAPEIHNEEFLAAKLRTLREHGFATQFQQRPTVRGGQIFKHADWRFWAIAGEERRPDGQPHPRPTGFSEYPPYVVKRGTDGRLDLDWVCLTVDATGGSISDTASALGLVGMAGKGERRLIIEDYTPGPRTWGQTMPAINAALISLANRTGWTTRIKVLVEKKALGEAAMGQLRDSLADGTLKTADGMTIQAVVSSYEPTGKGTKEQRAQVMEPMLEGGLMMLLDGAMWIDTPPAGSTTTLADEFGAHPHGQRNDRIDCVGQCIDEYLVQNAKSAWTKLFEDHTGDEDVGTVTTYSCLNCRGILDTEIVTMPEAHRNKDCRRCASTQMHDHYFVDGKCARCVILPPT